MPEPIVVLADGPDGPLPDPSRVGAIAALTDPQIHLGWVVRDPGWLGDGHRIATWMTGVGTKAAVRAGHVRAVPTRLSAIPGLLAGRLRPTVVVVSGVPDGDGWRYAANVGWAPDAVRHADAVVVEVDRRRPPLPTPPIEGRIVEVIGRADPADPPPVVKVGEVERAIARLVAGLVPEGATVQWGPGKLGAAFVDALQVPVGVRSGLVTDELVTLAERGLLASPAVAAYLWGGDALVDLVADGRLVMRPVSHTHDVTDLSRIERLVTVNTALEVGLDGAANVEGPAGRVTSGPGGHPDFCAGASRSPGGLSVIAVGSSFGGRSAIVARPEVVTAPRFDVDVVVTEHGIADLRDATPAERAERLVAVAAPEFRAELSSSC